jgi:hypothetical protein
MQECNIQTAQNQIKKMCLAPRYGATSDFGWKIWPGNVEVPCEYTECAVMDSRKGTGLNLGVR